MIARISGLGMGVGSISRLLRAVGVIGLLGAGLDTMRQVVVLLVLVCYDCLYQARRLEYSLTMAV